MRLTSPIAFDWGTLRCNYHGEKRDDGVGETLKDCWRIYPVKTNLRIHFAVYRYFWDGGCVFWHIGFKWWRRRRTN